jgi:hypothetical protein
MFENLKTAPRSYISRSRPLLSRQARQQSGLHPHISYKSRRIAGGSRKSCASLSFSHSFSNRTRSYPRNRRIFRPESRNRYRVHSQTSSKARDASYKNTLRKLPSFGQLFNR